MARKVYVAVTTRMILDLDEGIEVTEVLENMDYKFTSQTEGAVVVEPKSPIGMSRTPSRQRISPRTLGSLMRSDVPLCRCHDPHTSRENTMPHYTRQQVANRVQRILRVVEDRHDYFDIELVDGYANPATPIRPVASSPSPIGTPRPGGTTSGTVQ